MEDFNILITGSNKGVKINSTIQKIYIEVRSPSIENPYADFGRIEASIEASASVKALLMSVFFK